MPRTLFAIAIFLCAVHAAAAERHLCTLDSHPGATLLLPYFEVDADRADGLTTLFSLHNARARSTLARVVLWTDLAVPTFAFDVYLTGFDVQTINLRDVFNGQLPATGFGISPEGGLAVPAFGGPPGCDQPRPAVPVEHLRAAHSGQPTDSGLCASMAYFDSRLRGYLTIDVVRECSDLLPIDPGYFGSAGIAGIAGYDNVLWGDVFQLAPGDDNASGDSLVSLQADPWFFAPGDLTFYGRYLGGDASDAREPLPTVWALRTLRNAAADLASTAVVWRDVGAAAAPFPCDQRPAWYPRGQSAVFSFNEQEDFAQLAGPNPIPFAPFPRATQRAALAFGADYPLGFLQLDLNPSLDTRAQSFVAGVTTAEGRFSVERRATPLDSGCDPGGCTFGTATPAFELCLHSAEPFADTLEVGDLPRFSVTPGCYSSSCTEVFHASCTTSRAGNHFTLDTLFCLEAPTHDACTPDCGAYTGCPLDDDQGLAAGDYTVTAGELTLSFSVPTELPFGGLCVTPHDL